ncbi:protein of unknown function [Tenacibaculum sp. MAR_2009_124]|uniref:DUF4296 domain-containing protein n=1 Tax=Tenacibaculum sp. MAR_2009_124 TaxID=1250059 RepID=UPI000895FA35|nr:DUF4296 domain-containing protein [Tenacibaculum sp. MAR_2009_124]SEC31642.1 protein of unknown function [Tenacibaculum sp. MAR_2009_124]
MNKILYVFLLILLASCTSNTIYEKPKDLIPKDTMVSFLTDMYLASSAKNIKNKSLKKESNYVFLIYEKYKIDTTRFDRSNMYYTSKADEYSEILKKVKKKIDSLSTFYRNAKRAKDSLNRPEITKLKDGKVLEEKPSLSLDRPKMEELEGRE